VTAYASSLILGGSTLSDFCRVGANSTVIDTDAPACSVLVGTPARIISKVKVS
jgi:acetyltransferase-like isoleucine patch superfamily enzyme